MGLGFGPLCPQSTALRCQILNETRVYFIHRSTDSLRILIPFQPYLVHVITDVVSPNDNDVTTMTALTFPYDLRSQLAIGSREGGYPRQKSTFQHRRHVSKPGSMIRQTGQCAYPSLNYHQVPARVKASSLSDAISDMSLPHCDVE